MAKIIYVGNLAWETTSDDLLELFSKYGKVATTQVITDRETGRSRGFGFVEMENDDEAQKAMEALNGFEHGERPLTVNEAKPKEERGARSRRGAPPSGSRGGFGGTRGGFGGTDRGRRY